MKLKLYSTVILVVFAVMISGCRKSPYDQAVGYIDDLDDEVTAVTSSAEYDNVYQKITEIQSSPEFANLQSLTPSEKATVTEKMTTLTLNALAAKAVLHEMPDSIKLSSDDMKALCKLCIDKKANVLGNRFGYPEVKTIISDYYTAKP